MTVDDRKLDGIDWYHGQDGTGVDPDHRPEVDEIISDPRVRVVALKATTGMTGTDSEFKASWADLRRLVPNPCGKPHQPWIIAYHWRTPGDVPAQARHFRDFVGVLRDGEGVAVDFERDPAGKYDPPTYPEQRAFCAVVGQQFDRLTIRYGDDTGWNFAPYVKWTARYRPQKPAYPCALWQYGDDGSTVPGIQSPGGKPVDANRILDEAGLAKAFHAVSVPTPPTEDDMTPEQAKQLDELHTAMMAGWPAYGTQPVAKEVSRIGRMVRNLAVKAGIQVEPAD